MQHYFYSAAEGGALLLRSTHAPGLSSRRFFSNLAGLVRDYGAPAKVPRLQRLALYYGHNMELLSSHAGNAAVRAIALPLARLHGFRAAYAAYEPAEA